MSYLLCEPNILSAISYARCSVYCDRQMFQLGNNLTGYNTTHMLILSVTYRGAADMPGTARINNAPRPQRQSKVNVLSAKIHSLVTQALNPISSGRAFDHLSIVHNHQNVHMDQVHMNNIC